MEKKIKKFVAGTLIVSFLFISFSNTNTADAGGAADIASKCLGLDSIASDLLSSGKNKVVNGLKGKVTKTIEEKLSNFSNALTNVPVYDSAVAQTTMEASDSINQEITSKLEEGDTKSCLTAITDFALKVALARLKKELLDRIADQTLEWINNDFQGTPRFITNFGDVFDESINSAAGEVARDIGLGKLCDEKLSLKLQLNLKSPTTKRFTKEASCTLDKIVGNINAFGDDFRNGGWVGYTETLSPNNNRFGLEILALDQYVITQDKNEKEATTKTLANAGFKGEEVCDSWELSIVNIETGTEEEKINTSYEESFPNPKDPPPLMSSFTTSYLNGRGFTNNYLASKKLEPTEWVCVHTYQNTPGDTVKTALQSNFTQDQNYIANAENLEDYINVIFDAAVNRLINNGVKGLVNAGKGLLNNEGIKSNSGTGRTNSPYPDTGIKDRYNNNKDTNGIISSSTTSLNNQAIVNQRNQEIARLQARYTEAKTQIGNASSVLASAKISLDELTNKLTNLSNCEKIKSPLSGEICPTTKIQQTSINTYQTELTTANLLVATTTKLISQIPQPISSIPLADIPTTSSTITIIENNISTILKNASNAKVFATTKTAETNAFLPMCLNASVYNCSIYY